MDIAGVIISASLVRCLFVLPNAKTDSPQSVTIREPQRATIQRLEDEELKTLLRNTDDLSQRLPPGKGKCLEQT